MKLKQNKINNQPGFTLLEMITSISIIVMITAIFIANYHSNNKRTDLIMTAQRLVSDLHAAQNNTLGLVKYGNDVPAGGWGVNFTMETPDQYILFADLDKPASNNSYEQIAAEAGYMRYDAEARGEKDGEGIESQGARIVKLPKGITIDSINTGTSNVSGYQMANVTFLPPDPRTNIFNGTATSNQVTIKLKDERENSIKTVEVNYLGLIEVTD